MTKGSLTRRCYLPKTNLTIVVNTRLDIIIDKKKLKKKKVCQVHFDHRRTNAILPKGSLGSRKLENSKYFILSVKRTRSDMRWKVDIQAKIFYVI